MKRGWILFLFTIFLFTLLVAGAGLDTTKPYHNSTTVPLRVDGVSQTINAIDSTNFVYSLHKYYLVNLSSTDVGHDASKIWVSVKDGERTLLNALNSSLSPNFLCPANPIKTSYSNPAPNPGHYATEIQLSSGKSLQQSIDAGDFCSTTTLYTVSNFCPSGGTVTTSSTCYSATVPNGAKNNGNYAPGCSSLVTWYYQCSLGQFDVCDHHPICSNTPVISHK